MLQQLALTAASDLEFINVPYRSGYVCEVNDYVIEDQVPVTGADSKR